MNERGQKMIVKFSSQKKYINTVFGLLVASSVGMHSGVHDIEEELLSWSIVFNYDRSSQTTSYSFLLTTPVIDIINDYNNYHSDSL